MTKASLKLDVPAIYTRAQLMEAYGKRSIVENAVRLKKIFPVGSGYYRTDGLSRHQAEILIVAEFFPESILSGKTALRFHGLLPHDPQRIEVDIDRSKNQKNKLIHFHRVSPRRMIGITSSKLYERTIAIYDTERSLAELFLHDLSENLKRQVLKEYLRLGNVNIDRIREYDALLKTSIEKSLKKIRFDEDYLDSKGPNTAPWRLEVNDPHEAIRIRLLDAALTIYSQKGASGLGTQALADEAGVPLSTVAQYFSSRRTIILTVHTALERRVRNSIIPGMFIDLPPESVAFLQDMLLSILNATDQDEFNYRIQMWTIAENSNVSKVLIEDICSKMIEFIARLIQRDLPHISYQIAEARATMVAQSMDQYAIMRWYYIDKLKLQTAKHSFLDEYKNTLVDTLIKVAFSPL
ncbi:MAG: TetR family transcriptional regulator [Bdellovibrionaceae bacterium]|nr:TetR family transcriptional regulator [Pseudobdellovibrionaceae bacterium]